MRLFFQVELTFHGTDLLVSKNGEIHVVREGKKRLLKPFVANNYLKVNVPILRSDKGKYRYHQQRVDQLVCLAFKEEKPRKYGKIKHLDGDSKNCHVDNLVVSPNKSDSRELSAQSLTCKRGHKLVNENVYFDKRYSGAGAGTCKACARAKMDLRRHMDSEFSKNETFIKELADIYYLKNTSEEGDFRGQIAEKIEELKNRRDLGEPVL